MTNGPITNSISAAGQQAADTLRDIKPPVGIPNPWLWLWFGLGVLVVLAIVAGVILYYLMRRRRMPVPPAIPAHVWAKQKLDDALALIGQPKPFCVLVSDTVRLYLEHRFNFRAPERTTEEFLYELQSTNLLLPDQKVSLGEFLQQCDLVKFARYEPGERELRALHESAARLILETEPIEAPTPPISGAPPPIAGTPPPIVTPPPLPVSSTLKAQP